MDPFLGEIRALGGPVLPANWAYCDGSLLLIEENDALFQLIGTSYGGDGITNFALPDLRSRIPMGQSLRNLPGHQGGSELADLSVENLPAHRHLPACSTDDKPDTKDATNAFWSGAAEGGLRYAPAPGSVGMNAESIQQEGGGEPHENRMPVLAVNYIIALSGLYPSPA
ncbi:Microcystin-dependent protein [Dyadobacter sp. SG02]|uniref:phage tail protein n=1 Tax=Dyadobacter sp. SG02 TaxID=1855291 RepID=UPI0008CCC665|nr:tail fiber protein [Dyadobacter sp. SG02]SEJ65194.1 Microcystin-dependent protein [Dyadobacter sp. SG02]